MRKVCVVTGTRADMIMQNLIKLLHEDPKVELQLLVGDAPFTEFGNTIETIIADGFPISKESRSSFIFRYPYWDIQDDGSWDDFICYALNELAPDIMVVLGSL